jgi:3-oxoacyl-[acyl-carrier protein] reductase
VGLLDQKTAVITGASRGIGKAIAELFASEGAELVLIARTGQDLENLKTELESKQNRPVHIYAADIRKADELKAVFKDLNEKKIGADILVNNGGILIGSTLLTVKPELIEDTFSTNVYSAVYASQLALKLFLKKRSGSIINVSSIIGVEGASGQSIYSASKAALLGFTKSLSKELAPLNIRVNALAPGFIDTAMTQAMGADTAEKTIATIGMRRAGTALEVARVALFLASDLSTYVTGQVIGVDGGMVI